MQSYFTYIVTFKLSFLLLVPCINTTSLRIGNTPTNSEINNDTAPTYKLTEEELEYFSTRQKRWRRHGIDIDVSTDNIRHQKTYCNNLNIWTIRFYYIAIRPQGVDGMANSIDPYQIADLDLQCLPRPVYPKT